MKMKLLQAKSKNNKLSKEIEELKSKVEFL